MIKLQSRDYDILLGLRFGIVSEDDLIDEIFKTTLIDEAPEELQEFNIKRNLRVKQEFVANNEQLWSSIQQVFKPIEERNPKLKQELIQVVRKKGKHLGSQFAAKIKLLEQPIQLTRVLAIFNESVTLKDNEQKLKNKKQACRKVMKRLIDAKYVKKLDKPTRGGSERYYHLTKDGKFFVQEYMHELCMPKQEVVAHNWHTMHAKHDSMVSQVGKTIFALQNKQGYEVSIFLTESQMKRESLRYQHEQREKWGAKPSGIQYYPDLFVSLMLSSCEKKFLIEIDNATRSADKVLGKAQGKIPMLIICPDDQRVQNLIRSFKLLNCKAVVYLTVISEFKRKGMFDSRCWDFQRGCLDRLPKSRGG